MVPVNHHMTYFAMSRQWVFGSVYCSVNSFTSSLTVSVSVFTLLALTMERYKVAPQ